MAWWQMRSIGSLHLAFCGVYFVGQEYPERPAWGEPGSLGNVGQKDLGFIFLGCIYLKERMSGA